MIHRLTSAAILLVLLSAVAAAQEGSPATPEAAPSPTREANQPSLEIDPAFHDFGEVWQGEELKYTFELRNTGAAPLRIAKVGGSCGCAVLAFDRRIGPGGTGKVNVVIHTEQWPPGAHRASFMVESDDPDRPFQRLRLKATVVNEAYTLPHKLVLHGAPEGSWDFLVRADPKNPLRITEVTSDLEFLTFETMRLRKKKDLDEELVGGYPPRRGDHKVTVRFDGLPDEQLSRGTIRVLTTSSATPELLLEVHAWVPPWKLEPTPGSGVGGEAEGPADGAEGAPAPAPPTS